MHRFNPPAHYVIGLMDGRRSVQELWDAAIAALRRRRADAGRGDPAARPAARRRRAADRGDARRRRAAAPRAASAQRRAAAAATSPLALRIPLLDPGPLARALAAAGTGRCSGGWARCCGWRWSARRCVLAAAHWRELTERLADRVLAPREPAAAVAACSRWSSCCTSSAMPARPSAWGGEVHDMGVMLLVLMPVPYVDATRRRARFRETAPARAGRRRRHDGRALRRRARAVRVAAGRAGHGARHALQRDADRRRLDAALQRQPAAALRRLLHPRRPAARCPTCASAATRYWRYLVERHVLRPARQPSSARRARRARAGSPRSPWPRSSTACWSWSAIALFIASAVLLRRRAARAVGGGRHGRAAAVQGARATC